MLKNYWVVGGGIQDFSVSPRPLGFGILVFGAKGFGPGLDNKYLQGLSQVNLPLE